ncbi:hypothetical protein PLESTF_001830000 [Pleodorina starrii]|nr:hypothetical protein PLESTM_000856500 [Pleodorina starrii]GLC76754.1 hypothetical protein PLESTF_001830000 [Pleodorina starrii]
MMSQGPGWATSTSQTYQQDDSGGSGGMETAASNCHNEIIAAFRARDKEAVEERGGHLTALQLLPWLPLPAQQHPQHKFIKGASKESSPGSSSRSCSSDGASNSSSSDVSSGSDSSGSGGGAGDATSDLGRKLADMCCATMKDVVEALSQMDCHRGWADIRGHATACAAEAFQRASASPPSTPAAANSYSRPNHSATAAAAATLALPPPLLPPKLRLQHLSEVCGAATAAIAAATAPSPPPPRGALPLPPPTPTRSDPGSPSSSSASNGPLSPLPIPSWLMHSDVAGVWGGPLPTPGSPAVDCGSDESSPKQRGGATSGGQEVETAALEDLSPAVRQKMQSVLDKCRPHITAEHFDAGVLQRLLQLQDQFGEASAVSALDTIETAAGLAGVRRMRAFIATRLMDHQQQEVWKQDPRGYAQRQLTPDLIAVLDDLVRGGRGLRWKHFDPKVLDVVREVESPDVVRHCLSRVCAAELSSVRNVPAYLYTLLYRRVKATKQQATAGHYWRQQQQGQGQRQGQQLPMRQQQAEEAVQEDGGGIGGGFGFGGGGQSGWYGGAGAYNAYGMGGLGFFDGYGGYGGYGPCMFGM